MEWEQAGRQIADEVLLLLKVSTVQIPTLPFLQEVNLTCQNSRLSKN